jgi:signal transduction histidine kinase/ActR/RegA family two-component response regulator
MKLPVILRAAFAGALAVILAASVVSYRNSRTLLDESGWVIHTHEVRDALSELLSTLEAAETSVRGFMISGDETYLGNYNAAQREVPEQLRRLRSLVGDNAEQQWRQNGLEPQIEAWLAASREMIDARRRKGLAAEQRAVRGRLDSLRALIRDMREAENRLLQQRAEAVDDAARSAAESFAMTALLATALVGVLYLAVRRHLRAVDEAERGREALLSQEQAAHRAAKEARDKLEEADRAKDAFLATVSHELRTPLSPIMTWAEVLRRGNLDAQQVRLGVEAIQRSAKAQAQLIEDLLDVSRIAAGKMRIEVRPVDLAEVIRSAVDVVQPAADAKNIRLQSVLDTKTAPVSGDADRLQQVVWNLLANAVKFTPRGGRVTVVLERVNSHAEIAVSDTGQGIAADLLPNLFERFRQGDATTTRGSTGLGLGLAIARHIVEAHGGTVHAESPGPGKGSVFTVTLPLVLIPRAAGEVQRGHPTAATIPPQDQPVLDGLRVLVVDDEADSNEAIRVLLSSCGAEVRPATSAAQALEILGQWTPHLLVSDIGMPREDGCALIAKVRALEDGRKHIHAIALTAHASVEDRVRVLSAGFQMHLPKPVEPAELLAAVASVRHRVSLGNDSGQAARSARS